ncbi:hypothetical protein FD46_GL000253 [Liquorilactobacillus oeni DSM 19972]|uniref:Pycsar effector protein domain-containing protein n=2 Tax=Lactobacillaceae TaxID=33958 RepID=A0A0R1MNL4_9LACO|nr:hypothetical protein FD46_GL000253 [Liquorilactobacillus oeni DSM 19972]
MEIRHMINDNDKKIDYLKYTLDKQLNWIQKSDTKASIFLSATGVLITLLMNSKIITIFNNTAKYLHNRDSILLSFFVILLSISLCFIIIGGVFLFLSIIPDLKSSSHQKSHIYFGDIDTSGLTELQQFFKEDTNILDDLLNQIFVNAQIANKKMKKCNLGIKLACLGFCFIFILFVTSLIGLSIQ